MGLEKWGRQTSVHTQCGGGCCCVSHLELLRKKPLNAPHRSSASLGQRRLDLTHLFPMGHHTSALLRLFPGFPCGSDGKESVCNVGDLGSIPGLGRSPEEGKGYPLQYSGLENPHGLGSLGSPVHGVAKSQT